MGAGVQQLGLNGITLCCDPAEQTDWGPCLDPLSGTLNLSCSLVSCKGFTSHGFCVVLVTPGVPSSGRLAGLLEGRAASPRLSAPPPPVSLSFLRGVGQQIQLVALFAYTWPFCCRVSFQALPSVHLDPHFKQISSHVFLPQVTLVRATFQIIALKPGWTHVLACLVI